MIRKYLEGTADAAERAEAEEWLSGHLSDPVCDGIFEQVFQDMENQGRTLPADRLEIAVMERISAREEAQKRIRRSRILAWSSAAAAMIAVVFLLWAFRPAAKEVEWKMAVASEGENLELQLPDNSRLWLNSGTKVLYPSSFQGSERTVYVDGELFADISADKHHPFVLRSSGMKIKVLGTRFNMCSYASDPTAEVTLLSGRVEVEAELLGAIPGKGEATRSWIMSPGDFCRLEKDAGAVETYRVDPGSPESWTNRNNLRFINETLKGIAIDLERHFGTRITINDTTLARTRYFASFVNDEPLERIITALNPAIRIKKTENGLILSLK